MFKRAFPNPGLARLWDNTIIRIRQGHEQGWMNAAGVYKEHVAKAAPDMSYRIYRVTGGMPTGAYPIFSSVNSYAECDEMMAEETAMWEGSAPRTGRRWSSSWRTTSTA